MERDLDSSLNEYVEALKPLLRRHFLRIALLQSTTTLANLLLTLLDEPERNPHDALCAFFDTHTPMLARLPEAAGEAMEDRAATTAEPQDTNTIFGNAWTTFRQDTYEHSVALVEARLKASGIDQSAISGKRCFDGGCGIGRLSVALAKLGAREVVSVDRSEECLEYFRAAIKRMGLHNITVVQGDVTNLSAWPSESFDFVATNGVLHHTSDPIGGLQEHMRVVKSGGVLWVYLYGQGGVYWKIFDALRPIMHAIGAEAIRSMLMGMQLRPGFVYTFLDNMLAPRTYHTMDEVSGLLSAHHELTWREADGPSLYDSPSRTAASPAASYLLGPQGEVRMVIHKIRPKQPHGWA